MVAVGGCPDWPVSYAGCGSEDVMEALEEDARAAFEEMAVNYLWNWTGQVFGTCPVQIRPCRQVCLTGQSTFWGRGPYASPMGAPWQPALINGSMFNIYCGMCGQTCSCSAETPALVLPGPVDSVTAVIVDGVTLTAGVDYVLQNGNELRRIGAGWPICQNMDLDASQPDTWMVQYVRGIPVPVGGQVAAGILAVEFSKAACNDSSCALPRRLQSITRQGVTVAVLDSFDDIDKGHTGIWPIDSWIASVTKAPRGGRVYSPDVPRRGRMSPVPAPPPPPVP